MQKYLSICKSSRAAIEDNNIDALLKGISKIKEIEIIEYTDSDMISLQPSKELPLDGYVIFNEAGLKDMAEKIIKDNQPDMIFHNLNRGGGIFHASRVIPANSTMRYKINCVDFTEILLVSEERVIINASLTLQDNEPLPCQEFKSAEGYTILSIDAGSEPVPIIISISNSNKKNICCSIAVNE